MKLIFALAAFWFVISGSFGFPEELVEDQERYAMIFRSGFEEGVILKSPVTTSVWGGKWVQELFGLDLSTGCHWPLDLPGNTRHAKFEYLVGGWTPLSPIINTAIVPHIGHDGEPSRVLYQAVKRKYLKGSTLARNQFAIVNDATDSFRDIRVKYWLKLQPNLDRVLPANSWRQVMELREKDDAYRITLVIARRAADEPLYWVLGAQIGPRWLGAQYDWLYSNGDPTTGEVDDRVIPIGQWFSTEWSVKWGTGQDGTLMWKVNDRPFVEYAGRTALTRPYAFWHIMKVYASGNALDAGAHYQWIDDLEIEWG